ncbi:MAG: hypothetical protein ACSLE6_06520 [Mycobacterium sp.]
MRALDEHATGPPDPIVPTYAQRQPMRRGQIVEMNMPLGPSATQIRAGEQLRLLVAGRWLGARNLSPAVP